MYLTFKKMAFSYRGDSEQARTGFNWLPVTGPGTGHRRHHHGQLGLAVWVLALVYARYFPKTHGAPSRLLQQTCNFDAPQQGHFTARAG